MEYSFRLIIQRKLLVPLIFECNFHYEHLFDHNCGYSDWWTFCLTSCYIRRHEKSVWIFVYNQRRVGFCFNTEHWNYITIWFSVLDFTCINWNTVFVVIECVFKSISMKPSIRRGYKCPGINSISQLFNGIKRIQHHKRHQKHSSLLTISI